MNYINNNQLRQISFFVLLVALGILIFMELKSFIPAILGAVTFFIIMRQMMEMLVEKKRWNPNLAAILLMVISFLIVLVPIWGLITMLSSKINYAIDNSNQFFNVVQEIAQKIETKYNIVLFSGENISKASAALANLLPNIAGATFNLLTTMLVMYFVLYFMLINSKKIDEWLYQYLPLKKSNISSLGKELKMLVTSNAVGLPLIALLQGGVAYIGYLVLGISDPFFWFVATCISAMLPVVGAALVYVPLSVVLLFQGPAWKGIALLIYGFGVVGLVDNVFRIFIQKKLGDIHPIITIFGVFIGVKMFGFIGLIFGPILISMFFLLVKVYANEFK